MRFSTYARPQTVALPLNVRNSNARRWRSRLGAGASWRFEDPDLNGEMAAPVWLPDVRSDVLHVTIHDTWHGEFAEPLQLERLPGRKVVVRSQGVEYLWIRLPTGDFQLVATSFDAAPPGGTWLITVPIIAEGDRQLAAMLRFRRGLRLLAQRTADLPTDHLPVNRVLLARYLKALDGDLAGLTVRHIAERLFGAERVAEDVRTPNQNLIKQASYAVRRGRTLMVGGYLDLLKRA